jgi:hypothetical protein
VPTVPIEDTVAAEKLTTKAGELDTKVLPDNAYKTLKPGESYRPLFLRANCSQN